MPRVSVHREIKNVRDLRDLLSELDSADASDDVAVTIANCQAFAEWEIRRAVAVAEVVA